MVSKFYRLFVCLVLGVVVLFSGCVGPSVPAAPAEEVAPAVLVIVPMSGVVKTKLSFYGAGFIPGEKVRVILAIDEVPYSFGPAGTEETGTVGGIAIVNEQGTFKLNSRGGIPKALEPGLYAVEAVGDKGSRATAPLEVLEAE